jgi:heptosyltransferase I
LLRWDIPVPEDDRAFAGRCIPSGRRAVIISPCSSQRFRNYRNWSIENYAALADHAAQAHGAMVVLTGGPTELEERYAAGISSLARQARPLSLVGKTTLKQLLALLDRADVLICPDSGPAHMATAVGTPVIGLYATSNRMRTGPYLSQRWVVDHYPEAVGKEFDVEVDQLPWGGRVRDPGAMDLIKLGEVTARLDQLFASIKQEKT